MRLQQYITEGRTKIVEEENAVKVIRAKCMKHVKAILSGKRPHIYRGIQGFHAPYGIVDINSAGERKSRNTANYMTLLMDNLPSWKAYPKRSRSIICSSDSSNAASYGKLFYVYPTDDCDIGIVSANDVWDGFQGSMHTDIPQFNRLLKGHKISDDSWSKMKHDLIKFYEIDLRSMFSQQADAYKQKGEWNDSTANSVALSWSRAMSSAAGGINEVIKDFVFESVFEMFRGRKQPSIIDWFNDKLSPANNRFYLNNDAKMYGGREVWIGNGYMVMVSTTERDKMEQAGLF